MRAVVLDGHGDHQLADLPSPTPGPHDVVVAPAAVGVCGTDLHLVIGDYPTGRFPVVPGHEFSGTVTAVGTDVTSCTVGQHVAVNPNVACGECDDCLTGAPNLCEHLVPIGVAADGACAEAVSVPEKVVYPIPDDMTWAAGALIEPLACVLHGLSRAPSLDGRCVAIFGAGSIGLLAVVVAKARGASSITVIEPSPVRRDAALGLGAEHAVAPEEDITPRSIDVAIEASGHPAAVSAAIDSLDKRGTLLQMGVVSSERTIDLRPYDLFDRELSFIGSQSLANSFAEAVNLMPELADSLESLVTHTFPLEEFGAAIEAAHSDSALKVHITTTVGNPHNEKQE